MRPNIGQHNYYYYYYDYHLILLCISRQNVMNTTRQN